MAIVTPGTFTQAALVTEVQNDPKQLGYANINSAPELAALINTSPEPIAAGQREQIYRNTTPVQDLISQIVLSEWRGAGVTQADRDFITLVFSSANVKTGDANLRTQLGNVFAAGTTTRANLLAAAQKEASRAEALWGDGFRVTPQQAYDALQTLGRV